MILKINRSLGIKLEAHNLKRKRADKSMIVINDNQMTISVFYLKTEIKTNNTYKKPTRTRSAVASVEELCNGAQVEPMEEGHR